MTVTETTTQSWFSRLGDSFKGIVTGFVLVAVSIYVLFWNEGRTVQRYQDLKGAAADCVPVKTSPVNPENDGKPVYLTGEMKTDEVLADPQFPAVSVNGFKLHRTVEMYQNQEHESTKTQKKLGGGEETVKTHTYSKGWSKQPIDSSTFKEPGHDNPPMVLQSEDFTAQTAAIGDFDAAALIPLKNDTLQFTVKSAEEKSKEAAAPENAPVKATPAENTSPAPKADSTESTSTAGTEETETNELILEEVTEDVKAEETVTNETGAQDTAADEAGAQNPAADEAGAQNPAADEAGAKDTAADEAGAQNPAADEAGAQNPATDEAKAKDTVTDEAEAKDTVTDEAEAQKTVADEAKAKDTVTDEADAKDPAADKAKAEEPKAEVKDPNLPEGYQYYNRGYYRGKDPANPEIGDLQISFEYVPNGTVSVVAGQQGNKLIPWQSKNGTVMELRTGTVSQEQIIAEAQKANKTLAWILRAIGVFLMYMGFNMIFKPLSVIADVVPLIGNLVGGATGIISFILALSISCLTIGIAWVYYRPLIGIPLVIAAIALFCWSFKFGKKKNQVQDTTPDPAQDPAQDQAQENA